ncbi:MAG: aminodeoxychorismate lyase [Steroidobacteraceae bacterium]
MTRGGAPRSGSPDLVLVNGEPAASVSAVDRGLHYGDGVFETITCVRGRPRFLDRHQARLVEGCRRLALSTPPLEQLMTEIHAAAAPVDYALIKLIVTRGEAAARGYAPSGTERATRVLLRYPWAMDAPGLARHGVSVRIGQLRFGENPQLAGIKHLNRLEQVLARSEWRDATIFESLHFSTSDSLVSGTMSNVFIVHGRRLLTPDVGRCGVAGIMRGVVIDEARRAGLAVEVAQLSAGEVRLAEEMFLTNVRIGIVPVSRLGERHLAVGTTTKALQEQVSGVD